ncbi:DNA-protecting protein DprA [Candidatus Saccharibacteria bacterium]|nr:MAG: DNA-protecting protein DprA [Candidatus Saccharibacteria bacterium]
MRQPEDIQELRPDDPDYPAGLVAMPQPPQQLYLRGQLNGINDTPCLAVVGSRRVTPYGKNITYRLAYEAAKQGIAIISGLALGVDAIAHRAALDAGGRTVAVLANGLDDITPRSNAALGRDIIASGGALVGEYPAGTPAFRPSFVARNRIVSGLSSGILITEAVAKSGSLHTANFALGQGKPVLAVPGNITSPQSAGTNRLIQTGATPITCLEDILFALDIAAPTAQQRLVGANDQEQSILETISSGVSDIGELQLLSGLDPAVFGQTMTMLEISGKIRPLGAGHYALR